MERVDATGRARKASDKCSFAKVVEMERVDATGGACPSRNITAIIENKLIEL